jgi:catechol 2,3-dioxygenase-like lactoylglutathione lyase family enzyme
MIAHHINKYIISLTGRKRCNDIYKALQVYKKKQIKNKKHQMKQHIAHISLLVDDYDKAIKFYTEKLNFHLVENTVLSESKRWVLIAPPGSKECCLLLAKAANDEQKKNIGKQCGGRVFLFLHTDNFQRDYTNLLEQGITIVREPVKESWGIVAVFADLYGNLWDLIEAEII